MHRQVRKTSWDTESLIKISYQITTNIITNIINSLQITFKNLNWVKKVKRVTLGYQDLQRFLKTDNSFITEKVLLSHNSQKSRMD